MNSCMNILTRFFHQNSVGYSAQHCLMVMLEKFKESRDKGEELGAKLSWYGVTPISLKLIFSCLSNQTQCVKINNS